MDIAFEVRAWQDKVTRISRNLSELNEAEFIRQIRYRVKANATNAYTGRTLEAALAAIASLDTLWDDYLLLARVIEEALDLLKKHSMFHDTTDEIDRLLSGRSIQLPPVHVPLESRELVDTPETDNKTTPGFLLDAMTKAFAQARNTLTQIHKVEDGNSPRVTKLLEETEALRLWATNLGIPPGTEDKESVLVAIQKVTNDPLAATDQLDALQRLLERTQKAFQTLEVERNEVRVVLDQLGQQCNQLADLAGRSRKAIEDSKVALVLEPAAFGEPTSEQAIQSLRAWVATLESNFVANNIKAVKVGATKCGKAIAEQLSREQSTYVKNRVGLDKLSELTGLLTAYRAKAKAMQANGIAFDATTIDLKERAKHLLVQQPIDLAVAEQAIQAFELALRAARPVKG